MWGGVGVDGMHGLTERLGDGEGNQKGGAKKKKFKSAANVGTYTECTIQSCYRWLSLFVCNNLAPVCRKVISNGAGLTL